MVIYLQESDVTYKHINVFIIVVSSFSKSYTYDRYELKIMIKIMKGFYLHHTS